MGFISYFSVTPGIGFNCLNCRFAGNLYGCYESFLCSLGRQSLAMGWEKTGMGMSIVDTMGL